MAELCSQWENVAEDVGLDFVYENGAQGESLMVEVMGGGAGVLDYDRDGRWDLFLCQGGDPAAEPDEPQPPSALFRNESSGRFVDVSAGGGIGTYGYGQGVAIGDYNADGFDDIYLTNVGKNRLLKNMGDGTFLDVTDRAGVGGAQWSSSAAFADLTGDGLLDLFVCDYVRYDPRNPVECRNEQGEHRICHPQDMEDWPNKCYVNVGDGTFREEAEQRGLVGDGSKSLGVVVADFNGDDLPDVYVANDTTANFLYINQGEGQFSEQGVLLGCGMSHDGAYEASMGLAAGDYDRNGWIDLYSTHFYQESNTLYRNLGPSGFQDVTGLVGLHEPTMLRLGFGTVMQDFNQDGWQDLMVANGHIENYPDNPLHEMQPQVFSYDGTSWRECTAHGGEYFQGKYVGRGVAQMDYDDDGDVDLVVIHQNAPAALLRNHSNREGSGRGHWLKMTFQGRESNRRGIGCQVTVQADEVRHVQQLFAGGSYASSHQPALFFGIGDYAGPCRVEVRWPSGKTQVIQDVVVDQTLVLSEADAQ